MGVVNGEVRVSINITGSGDGTRVLNSAAGAQDRLASASDRAGAAAGRQRTATAGLQQSGLELVTTLLREHTAMEQLGAQGPALAASIERIDAAQKNGLKSVEAQIAAQERLRAVLKTRGIEDASLERGIREQLTSLDAQRQRLLAVGEFTASYTERTKGAAAASSQTARAVGAKGLALGALTKAASQAIGPVDSLQGSIARMPGALGLVGQAIGVVVGVGAGLVSLFESLGQSVPDYITATRVAVESTNRMAGALGGLVDKAGKALVGLHAINKSIREMRVNSVRLAGNEDMAEHLERMGKGEDLGEDIKALDKTIKDQVSQAGHLARTREQARRANLSLEARRKKLQEEIEREERRALAAQPSRPSAARDEAAQNNRERVQALAELSVAQLNNTVIMEAAAAAERELTREVDAHRAKLRLLKQAQEEANIIVFDPDEVKPDKPTSPTKAPRLESDAREMAARMRRDFEERAKETDARELAAALAEDYADRADKATRHFASAAESGAALASTIRDVASTFVESVPGLDEFSGALSRVASEFEAVRAANENVLKVREDHIKGVASLADVELALADAKAKTVSATINSVGALARAGAEQIKNDRLRAGVLAIIELGLGLGKQFVPGLQDQAMGHFAAAATLGAVAIFGGGGGGGSSAAKAPRSVARPLGVGSASSGQVNITFNAPYIATGTVQETAAELSSWIQRAGSGGFSEAA